MQVAFSAEFDGLLRLGPAAYQEVVLDDVYRLEHYRAQANPQVLFDLGANRGCFSAVAAQVWPHTELIALEPHGPTFEALRSIVPHVPHLTALRAAIADGSGFFTEAASECGHQYSGREASPQSVPTAVKIVTPDELVAMASGRSYGFKMDIEGTEFELLTDQHEHFFRNAVIWWMEIHIPTIADFLSGQIEPNQEFLERRLDRAQRALWWLHRQTTSHELFLWLPNPVIWMATGVKTVRPWRT